MGRGISILVANFVSKKYWKTKEVGFLSGANDFVQAGVIWLSAFRNIINAIVQKGFQFKAQ